MYIAIQTIDGQFFNSDDFNLDGLDLREIDVVVGQLTGLFQDWRNMDYFSLEIGGRKKYFNPANLLWAEIVE